MALKWLFCNAKYNKRPMYATALAQNLRNDRNILRDDGLSYGDYPGSSPGQA